MSPALKFASCLNAAAPTGRLLVRRRRWSRIAVSSALTSGVTSEASGSVSSSSLSCTLPASGEV
jgi:hypothetical protein